MTEIELHDIALELGIPIPRRGTQEFALWRHYVAQAAKALMQGNRILARLWVEEATTLRRLR